MSRGLRPLAVLVTVASIGTGASYSYAADGNAGSKRALSPGTLPPKRSSHLKGAPGKLPSKGSSRVKSLAPGKLPPKGSSR
jgi:hypothetical protein